MSSLDKITLDRDPSEYNLDMTSVHHRNGRLRAEVSISLSDFKWIQERYDIAKMLVSAATKRLLVDRTLEAVDNFEKAMARHAEVASRIQIAIVRQTTLIDDVDEGEREQQRRRDEARRRLVAEATGRKPLPLGQNVIVKRLEPSFTDVEAQRIVEAMPSRAP